MYQSIYYYYYLCFMEKAKENERKVNKTKLFSFKVSDQFLEIMRDLADKKGMSKGAMIEYLIRREHDFLNRTIEKQEK